MAEFKISRLRYNWEGEWETDKDYIRDAVVRYNGKTYVCFEAHTSGDFYEDLNHTTEIGALTPYWRLMLDGKEWKQAWEPTTYYSIGNIVTYGGIVYVCTTQHVSGSVIDQTKWSTYSRFDNWHTGWSISYAYGLGDVVKYGGIVYRCTTNHISAATTALGLEANLGNWEVVNNGIDYKGDWTSASYRYRKNDIVNHGSDLWICTAGHTSSTLIDHTKFDLWLPGNEFNSTWSDTSAYQPNDVVMYGGYSYVSNTENNIGNIPSIEASDWTLLTTGYRLQNDWVSNTSYKVGDTVRHGGALFSALQDNTTQDPFGFSVSKTYTASGSSGTTIVVDSISGIVPGMIVIGTGFVSGQSVVQAYLDGLVPTVILNNVPDAELTDNQSLTFIGISTYWSLVVPGSKWTGIWIANHAYSIGEIAILGPTTYECIQNHTSSDLTTPITDTTNQYWKIYIIHARGNALTRDGDLVTFGETSSIPVEIGTQDQVLRVTGHTPNWQKIFVTPNVYYVTPEGVDDADHGDTWDKPWKTINHACEIVSNGFFFQDARSLLQLNKEFLIEEMYQWMLYQSEHDMLPFSSTNTTWDNGKGQRDARYVVNALIYDMSRGGNSQIVAAANAFFAQETPYEFITPGTAEQIDIFSASLQRLNTLISAVSSNTSIGQSYQDLNSVPEPIEQIFGTVEPLAQSEILSLFDILLTALTEQNATSIPAPNSGVSATINIKSGTYHEILPISVPENTALAGDELRGAVVKPLLTINTTVTNTSASTNLFTTPTTYGMEDGVPVQFGGSLIGGVTRGQVYYVIGESITETTFSVSETVGGTAIPLTSGTFGEMLVYGGDAISNMFFMRNGTGLRNLTCSGLLGSLSSQNEFLTQRPTGGSFVSLDPGTGPDDTSAWIYRRSPYMQNVTNFGTGCTGMKIDGELHNGGLKSMVCNDFTQIISDGIGIWTTGSGSVCEAVSVFSYYCYAGYFSEAGGKIRATNGNSSYGTYGVIAEGYDVSETPVTGTIDNRSTQARASVQSAFGVNSELLKLQYHNAGSNYYDTTTNLLRYSNNFIVSPWVDDSNINYQQNIISPTGYSDGWTFTSTTSGTDSCYIYQDITIPTAGAIYTDLAGETITGSGEGATFTVTVNSTSYSVSVTNGGNNYVSGNELQIAGNLLGGIAGVNDLTIVVDTLIGSGIYTVITSGTVPAGSDLHYTFSVHCKQGTSPSFDMYAIFSGDNSVASAINYNFNTNTITPSSQDGGGVEPTQYGVEILNNGWSRVWFSIYDLSGLNTSVRFKLYPRSRTGGSGTIYIYGAQAEVNESPNFYLSTVNNRQTAYVDFVINGAGTDAYLIGDEPRSNSIFQTRVTDLTGDGSGGQGYLTASNNAQGGNTSFVILAGSDINTATNYTGMRVFINSGTGAGQYGYISYYDDLNKNAFVLKESFTPITVIESMSSTDELILDNLADTDTLFQYQPIQFVPTYYKTTVTSTSEDQLTITQTVGGLVNTLFVDNTSRLYLNMPITFSGSIFGGLISNYTYYVSNIIDGTTFQISTELYGSTWFLLSGTGSMTMNIPAITSYLKGSTTNMDINMPIQFTGSSLGGITNGILYYINDVIDPSTFTISSALVTITATATTATGSTITVDSTTNLKPLYPIKFSGTTFGNVELNTKYYISKIIDVNTISISETLITTTATATADSSNLITVTSTTGFIANNPIVFVGNAFGNLIAERVYYILAINDDYTFTISSTLGGSAVNLASATGQIIVKTSPTSFAVTDASGTMSGTTTSSKFTLTASSGTMNSLFSTPLFGGVEAGVTYYVLSVNLGNPNKITITDSDTGITAVSLVDSTGSMAFGHAGWDHINPGTPAAASLDSTSVYYIEPKITYSEPDWSQGTASLVSQAPGTSYVGITYGNNTFVAVPNNNSTIARSVDGAVWTATTLPYSATWSDVAYGDMFWVIISNSNNPTESGSRVMWSNSAGQTWKLRFLPSKSNWTKVVYGNGIFVAISPFVTLTSTDSESAYSTDFGRTWLAGTGLDATTVWTDVCYGNGKFVAVSDSNQVAYTTDGAIWSSETMPGLSYESVAYGNGRFVAVTSSGVPAYSFDAITWYESPYSINATNLSYGQGVFLAINSGSTVAYTSEDGYSWKTRTITSGNFTDMTFGFNSTTHNGIFVAVSDTSSGKTFEAGCRAKGRAIISSNQITEITSWEPGSGYKGQETVEFFDPNVTLEATIELRTGNGAISNPTFNNPGQGYNTSSTEISIFGSGFADEYQYGLSLVLNNLTKLPRPGDNLVVDGNEIVYKVTSAEILNGTVAPNLTARVSISPEMTVQLSPDNGTDITIRQLYSQVRLTGHDYLNVGYGTQSQSNYPGVPTETELTPQTQAVEANYGRVFYTSTDQDGNFKVGGLFGVEQATGIVTISASQFGLSGLETLSLGGIAVGGSGVIVNQFSTDPTFVANSNNIIPTQKAIRSYLAGRLTQGGSNTFTGQATAGQVIIGGPDKIDNTIPQGLDGSSVQMVNLVNMQGEYAGVDGDMAALMYFMQMWDR